MLMSTLEMVRIIDQILESIIKPASIARWSTFKSESEDCNHRSQSLLMMNLRTAYDFTRHKNRLQKQDSTDVC